MKVECTRCGVSNQVTREKWKCRKCSTKHTTHVTILEPEIIVHDEGIIVTDASGDEETDSSFLPDSDDWYNSEEKIDDGEEDSKEDSKEE